MGFDKDNLDSVEVLPNWNRNLCARSCCGLIQMMCDINELRDDKFLNGSKLVAVKENPL